MPVAKDAAASGTGSGTTLNWTHTCTGADRVLTVYAGGWDTSGKTATATYNGVAMDPIASASIIGGGGDGIYAFGMKNPPAGSAYTVAVTFSASVTGTVGYSQSFTGADQTTGWGTGTTASGSDDTPVVSVTSAVGEYVVDFVVYDQTGSKTIAPHASQVEEVDVVASGEGGAGSTEAGAASVSMDWVISATANHVIAGISILAVAAVPFDQEGYRFRNDDGSETTATWKAAQDVSASITPDETFRLRALVNATGDPASQQYKLQYRKVGDASWRDVDTQG